MGQEEVALEVPEVLAEAQGQEALEVPVPVEAEEEVVVLEVIRKKFKAWFNYLNMKPKSIYHYIPSRIIDQHCEAIKNYEIEH